MVRKVDQQGILRDFAGARMPGKAWNSLTLILSRKDLTLSRR